MIVRWSGALEALWWYLPSDVTGAGSEKHRECHGYEQYVTYYWPIMSRPCGDPP